MIIWFFITLLHIAVLSAYAQEYNNCDGVRESGAHTSDIQQHNQHVKIKRLPAWLQASALEKAPIMMQGFLKYHSMKNTSISIPSYNRLILVGPPGSGKSTLARAFAQEINADYFVKDAGHFIGHYRNETAQKLREFFDYVIDSQEENKVVVVIDELHKLFENYRANNSDDSMTAASFWAMLDVLEERYPNIIVIGTMNEACRLPSEMLSRFHGKIVTIERVSSDAFEQIFDEMIDQDRSVEVDCHPVYMWWLITQMRGYSIRDLKFFIDTAKIISIAHDNVTEDNKIVLTRHSFDQSLAQLKNESFEHKESFITLHKETIYRWNVATGLMLNALALYHYGKRVINYCSSILYISQLPHDSQSGYDRVIGW